MALTISPNTAQSTTLGTPVCFQAQAIQVIPQEDERNADFPASGTGYTYNVNTGFWKRTGGTSGNFFQPWTLGPTVFGKQPFHFVATNWTFVTPSSPNRFHDTYHGIFDDNSVFYGWQLYKNCGAQSTGDCSGPNTDNSKWSARVRIGSSVVGLFTVNFKENFRVRSDGTYLHWDIFTAGAIAGYPSSPVARWVNSLYIYPLPQTNVFQFGINALYVGNELSFVKTFKGTYQGPVPVTWTAPLGGSISVNGDTGCFAAPTTGDYTVCVDSELDDQICIPVSVAPAYFRPRGFDCGGCTFTGTTVEFETNGGSGGVLTADGGVVVDSTTWIAPGTPGSYTLTYTINGAQLTCVINVVEQLRLLNVEGDTITGLIPGEQFQLITNYPSYPDEGVEWENLDCPNIVSRSGLITVPLRPNDQCFGEVDCKIRCRLTGIPDLECTNLTEGEDQVYFDIRIIVDPVFPTPKFGGPQPVKWKPETPDFRVVVNEFEGGCDETYVRNLVPIQKWTVRYAGLPYHLESPCAPEPCCPEPQGFTNGYNPDDQSAKILDDFWMLVGGQYRYFTVFDFRTGEAWRRVRFDGTMERDHINWNRTQSRELKLVWRPCCATAPLGGVCQHQTVITDRFAPTVPQNLSVELAMNTNIVTWSLSFDDVGVKNYEIEIDGLVFNAGNVLYYYHNVEPGSDHSYRVRAVDFSGAFSDWTAPQNVTSLDPTPGTNLVTEAGDQVQEAGEDVVD